MDTKVSYTGSDLLELSGDYELEEGKLVTVTPPGGEHGEIVVELATLLQAHCKAHQLGKVVVESGFYLSRSPDTVRAPDISFYSLARLGSRSPTGYFEIAPDLAVEVISPHDSGEETEARVRQFLAAGVGEVWIIYPRSQTIHRYRHDGRALVLSSQDALLGEDLVPKFYCRLSDIFPD